MKSRFLWAMAVALVISQAHADTNLLVNGDFSGGTYTSTIGGFTNQAPIGWTVNLGWDFLSSGSHFSGITCLSPADCFAVLGNFAGDPIAGISQGFDDVRRLIG
jgi:hypothetical protein